MRIVVHDYSGHPFQVQLSRELARQGHDVLHLYSASFQTPKGGVLPRAGDAPSFTVEGIRLEDSFSKYDHFAKRRRQEIRYGELAARRIAEFGPDVVLSANTPLDAQRIILKTAKTLGARFIFWLQDIYSAGITEGLRKRKFPLAHLVGAWYRRIERKLLRQSDAIITISTDFARALENWGIDPASVHTIENWAPWDELQPCPQDNVWSRLHGFAGKFVFLYSGTIGMKHNPSVLLELGEAMRNEPEVAVVVISEGNGADWIRNEASLRRLHNIHCLPLQPYELLAETFSTGSVLMALLDESAGEFSVPSKVLSYMCAGRPLLLSVPERNAVARLVRANSAGIVVRPGDSAAFVTAAIQLYGNGRLRDLFGANAHAYARHSFDVESIAKRFAGICGLTPQAQASPVLRELAATH
ncbi:MAG TPA: glycosyltransferase family 4 protein [Bryobacteraceae bacterium]|jgi:glycosyltransferase involved in cell wall biosynthesis|nr:glycosyltransferase family 4 protein [Bryobacteraceae bacterium]